LSDLQPPGAGAETTVSPHIRFEANIANLEANKLKRNSEWLDSLMFVSKRMRKFGKQNEYDMKRIEGKGK
jgi:hypothetical protein